MNKKCAEDTHWTFVTGLIIFLIALAVLIVLVVSKVSPGQFNNTASVFSKSVYNALCGGSG